MYIFLMVIYIIVCICLVAVILMQSGKGGGLSETLGGGFQTLFGPKTTNVLVKATATLATLFILLTLILGKMTNLQSRSLIDSSKADTAQEETK